MKIVECWVEQPVRQLNRTFTYLYDGEITPGTRVNINFNYKNLIGFVESVKDSPLSREQIQAEYPYELKFIERVIDREPLITPELHDLAEWMAEQTLSTVIACFQTMLPPSIRPATTKAKKVYVRWIETTEAKAQLTLRQAEAFRYLLEHGPMPYSGFRKLYPLQARQLIEKGVAVQFEREKEAEEMIGQTGRPHCLNEEQAAALKSIETGENPVYLLHGVTGSGKTEVYLQLAEHVLKQGRQVLFLVPEIGLTPQMIDRVQSRFGVDLAIYHSGLNNQEKYEQFKKVKNGQAAVVVGTRSSVFLPFRDLGLIVMDEEHDASYKQDRNPAYHCRDVAVWRGRYHHCKVVLGSATPCLESYARGLKQVYRLIKLEHRINEQLPEIRAVSVTEALRKGGSYLLTDELKEKMEQTLARNEQVILLLNRRGYQTVMRCRNCGEVLMCPHCELAMSYHRDEGLMKCHTCGTVMRIPRHCPSCGSDRGFTGYGTGTQKAEEEVRRFFPSAKVLRMDADTTSSKNSHQRILRAFGNHEADILLGTQMIAKGLDYPDVTLVGVLNGDDGLSRTDYRSSEMTFNLLMQASGRSGRSDKPGEVILQVYDPQHYVVQSVLKQDYESFFYREMQFRHVAFYPPYSYLIAITVQSAKQEKSSAAADWIKNHLTGDFKLMGPGTLNKIMDLYRCRILMKGKDLDQMRRAVREILDQYEYTGGVSIRVDVNPQVLD